MKVYHLGDVTSARPGSPRMSDGMPGEHELGIIRMEDHHLREVFSLIERENWGWEYDEVRRIHAIDPGSSVVAHDGKELVGLVTCINYGTFAFVVHVIVKEGRRGRRVGLCMMETVLADLDSAGVSEVELHANPEAEDFYSQFGFTRVEDISFLSREGPHRHANPEGDAGCVYSWLTQKDLQLVPGLVAKTLGLREDETVAALAKDPPHHALARVRAGAATAALLSRTGLHLNAMGPWVMEDPSEEDAVEMMRRMMASVPSKRCDVCAPSSSEVAIGALRSCGFTLAKGGIVRLSRSGRRAQRFPRSLLAVGHQGMI